MVRLEKGRRSEDQALFESLSKEILEPRTGFRELIPQMLQVVALLERNADSSLNNVLNIGVDRTDSSSGVALSPSAAALCAREVFRSAAFIKGLAGAVSSAVRSDRPVRVLYAGCGPYALLALPLMAVFPAHEVVFTLIDIHSASLQSARSFIERFGFSDRVQDYVLADATEYIIPESFVPDVIVSETMNVCLGKEPQVAITRHMLAQAPGAIMVPKAIRVDAALLDPSQEAAMALSLDVESDPKPERIDLGNVFELNEETVRTWTDLGEEELPASKITVPRTFDPRFEFRLLTRIHVYGDIRLRDTDCSLTLPRPLAGRPRFLSGEQLQFRYMLGAKPGLAYEVINEPIGSV